MGHTPGIFCPCVQKNTVEYRKTRAPKPENRVRGLDQSVDVYESENTTHEIKAKRTEQIMSHFKTAHTKLQRAAAKIERLRDNAEKPAARINGVEQIRHR